MPTRRNAFWSRYVKMNQADVIYVSSVEPDFAGMLNFVFLNRLYGFQEYTGPCAYPNTQNNKFIGGRG